jgi:hypothetical protein
VLSLLRQWVCFSLVGETRVFFITLWNAHLKEEARESRSSRLALDVHYKWEVCQESEQ